MDLDIHKNSVKLFFERKHLPSPPPPPPPLLILNFLGAIENFLFNLKLLVCPVKV